MKESFYQIVAEMLMEVHQDCQILYGSALITEFENSNCSDDEPWMQELRQPLQKHKSICKQINQPIWTTYPHKKYVPFYQRMKAYNERRYQEHLAKQQAIIKAKTVQNSSFVLFRPISMQELGVPSNQRPNLSQKEKKNKQIKDQLWFQGQANEAMREEFEEYQLEVEDESQANLLFEEYMRDQTRKDNVSTTKAVQKQLAQEMAKESNKRFDRLLKGRNSVGTAQKAAKQVQRDQNDLVCVSIDQQQKSIRSHQIRNGQSRRQLQTKLAELQSRYHRFKF